MAAGRPWDELCGRWRGFWRTTALSTTKRTPFKFFHVLWLSMVTSVRWWPLTPTGPSVSRVRRETGGVASGPRSSYFQTLPHFSPQGAHLQGAHRGKDPRKPSSKIRSNQKQGSGPTVDRFPLRMLTRAPCSPLDQQKCANARARGHHREDQRSRTSDLSYLLDTPRREPAHWTFPPKPGDPPSCRDDFAKPSRSTP